MKVFVGLEQMSCDMCNKLERPHKVIIHGTGDMAKICDVCYGKCLVYPKFQEGIKSGEIRVSNN